MAKLPKLVALSHIEDAEKAAKIKDCITQKIKILKELQKCYSKGIGVPKLPMEANRLCALADKCTNENNKNQVL